MPASELSLKRSLFSPPVSAATFIVIGKELAKPVMYKEFVITASGFNIEKMLNLNPFLHEDVEINASDLQELVETVNSEMG